MMIRPRRRRRTALAVLLLLALSSSACGGASEDDVQKAVSDALASQQAAAPQTPEAPAAPPATAPAAPASPAAPPPPPAVKTVNFTMPDFRGMSLQKAQDQIQELGVFFSVSHDMLASRSQFLDANWRVCDQTPAAGAKVQGPAEDWEGKIDFGAVKLEEDCPN